MLHQFKCTPMPQNNHPTTAQGSQGFVRGDPEIAIFQRTHASLKTAESLLVGPHREATTRKLEIAPRLAVIGEGVHGEEKNGTDMGSDQRIVAIVGQPIFA